MRVVLLKDFDGKPKGLTYEATKERANYLIRCGVAKKYVKKKKKTPENKELKVNLETK